MVGDDHQVARAERGVDAARGVRYEQEADAQLLHDTDREGHLLHRVALIIVEPPLHGHDAAAFDLAENQPSAMPLDGRDGESGNILVVDGVTGRDPVGEASEAGAEHDTHLGGVIVRGLAQEGSGLFNFL